MPQGEFSYDQLASAALIVDTIYHGGPQKHVGADPLSRLLSGCGNRGGFRPTGRRGNYRYFVLFSTGEEPDWPDHLDLSTGVFTYYGDNRTTGSPIDATPGNRILRDVFNALHETPPARQSIPPFLVFEKVTGRDVRFLGLAAPGADNVASVDQLIGIWRSGPKGRFENYRALFTILREGIVRREWLDQLRSGDGLAEACPPVWRAWVETGTYQPLLAPPSRRYRTPPEQLPAPGTETEIVEAIQEYFRDDPHAFEDCAILLARYADPNIVEIERTRPSADGGRDGIGLYRIGGRGNAHAVTVDFALEEKCYGLHHSVGVREVSRLVSRLRHRQFGVLVTTSYLGLQAYQEIVEDGHPILVICAKDNVHLLAEKGRSTRATVTEWLIQNFPLSRHSPPTLGRHP
jgi:hypothetical protein